MDRSSKNDVAMTFMIASGVLKIKSCIYQKDPWASKKRDLDFTNSKRCRKYD